jgi:hypothetical protein
LEGEVVFFGSLIAAINRLIGVIVKLTSAVEELEDATSRQTFVDKVLTDEIRKLTKVIGLRTPGLVLLRKISDGVDGMGKYVLVLPTPGAIDVVSRELVVSINGGEPVTQMLAGTALESEQFEAVEDDIVSGSLVDIDDAKPTPLRSEPRLYELPILDTTAPPQPGEIGIRAITEV